MLDYAHKLDDLRSPPGYRLEALKRDVSDPHSLRINDQWRVVSAGPMPASDDAADGLDQMLISDN